MPYDRRDYPASLKNFDQATRDKAIDIINAMLTDGYDEDEAIPIAISQAKEWKEGASQSEEKEIQQKDLKDHEESADSSAELSDEDVVVQYRDDEDKWEVRTKGADRADSLHDTKKEARDRAQEMMEYRDADLDVKTKKESEQ